MSTLQEWNLLFHQCKKARFISQHSRSASSSAEPILWISNSCFRKKSFTNLDRPFALVVVFISSHHCCQTSLSGISEQLLGVGMTLCLGRRHAYEKDTLLQTMRLPLGESGVWGSRIPPVVKARWQRVGTTRIRASKHGSFWKVPATSLQLNCLEPTHATDHASGGPRLWIKGCESFLHLNHQLRKFCSTKFSPFIPKNLRRGSSRCRGQVLDETGSL